MAATKLTFRQVYIKDGDEITIPHVESGWIQVFDLADAFGGGDRPWLLRYAVIEPLSKDEERKIEDRWDRWEDIKWPTDANAQRAFLERSIGIDHPEVRDTDEYRQLTNGSALHPDQLSEFYARFIAEGARRHSTRTEGARA